MAKIKKKLIVSYENLPSNVLEALNKKYPDGIENHLIRIDKKPGDFFYGVTIDLDDISYLVKINVAVDSNLDDLEEKLFESHDTDDTIIPNIEDDAIPDNLASDEDE
jgi:hypothetical protein